MRDHRVWRLRNPTPTRAAWLGGMIALHLTTQHVVTSLNALRPASSLFDFTTGLDRLIPYLGWTSVVYPASYFYIIPWAAAIMWRMDARGSSAMVKTYVITILMGTGIQLLLPAKAPLPMELNSFQEAFHDLFPVPPYACLPSMHVALTTLPAVLAFNVFDSRGTLVLSTIAAVVISASTMTTKEHYALDAVTGLVLALACYALFWRRRVPGAAHARRIGE